MSEQDKLDRRPELEEEELREDEGLEVEIGNEWMAEGEEGEKAAAGELQQDEAAQASKPASSRLPWALFAISLIAIAVLLFTGKPGMNGAAAKINGEKVSKDELYQAMLKQGGDAALDSLIMDKLIAQEAAKKSIKVTDQEMDAELKDIKAKFPDEAQFQATLDQYKMTLEQLKGQIRNQLLMTKLFESQMDLTDAKQKEFFEKHKDQYATPEQIDVHHILVEKKEDADKLLADLKAGADFAAKAKEKSMDPGSKDKGGSLGLYSKGQGFDPTFETAAFKLEKGGMSDVVQTQFGFHIIKVTDKKAAVSPNFEAQKDQVRKDMVNEEMGAKAEEWMNKLKTDAKIEKL